MRPFSPFSWFLAILALPLACAQSLEPDDAEEGSGGAKAASGGRGGETIATGGSGQGGLAGERATDGMGGADRSPGGSEFPSLIALTTILFDDTISSTYVALLDSLEGQELDLGDAREFAGWASVATHDGFFYVGEGDTPVARRYEIGADGELGSAGVSMSFAKYGFSDAPLGFNTFVDAQMAHMSVDVTSRILWDPGTMTILALVETPEIELKRDGLELTAANFEGRVARDSDVVQPFFWHDADWYEFHQNSQIAFYSRDAKLEKLLDVPCPGLQTATEDEDGNLYLSGMADTIPFQLREGTDLERCVARIDAGQQKLAPGWPRRFEDLTGGRPTGSFYYLKEGIGILQVYHSENIEPDSETFLDEWYRDHWGLWLVDLKDFSAEPITEWPLGSANVFFSRLGDRLFVHRVSSDFSETTFFEIDVEGRYRQILSVPGYAASPLLGVR